MVFRPVLAGVPFIGFIPVRDEARGFYERVLGLRVVEDTPFALVFDASGTMLRLTPVPELAAPPFTIRLASAPTSRRPHASARSRPSVGGPSGPGLGSPSRCRRG